MAEPEVGVLHPADDDESAVDIAYIVSRFPSITETFIVDEINELTRQGQRIHLFSLLRSGEAAVHPGAKSLLPQAIFGVRSPLRLAIANWRWLRRGPRQMFRFWRDAMKRSASARERIRNSVTLLMAPAWADDLSALGPIHIHAHWATQPGLAAMTLGHITGLPFSITAHAFDLFLENGLLPTKLDRARFVVTISDFNRSMMIDSFAASPDKIHVIRCGVDLDKFTPSLTRRGDLLDAHILCVASLSDYKGHRYLMEAVVKLRRQGSQVRCTLVGDGPLRPAIEEQISALGLDDVVRLTGVQTAPQVRQFLTESDIFVLPSIRTPGGLMEGVPVALMEAMASGRPVVATRLSGVPELVEHEATGLLAEPANPAELAIAIERLATDEFLRDRLTGAGLARVRATYELGRNVRDLKALFKSSLTPLDAPEPSS